ncbi:anti-sigma factor family protein [Butyricimonas paravirosa]|uniref:anti-sigma factor family protein n=1 Tax=Butyricimonas paravirosa TaxID=1472417 RepID=UPI0022E52C22|nr:hypothetical protein [Butyricimonas paravirosa]
MEEKKCTYTTAQIGQYMMNKMSPEEETLLQEHLYLCPECSRKLQEMRRLAETLADRQVKMVDKKKLRQRNFVKILVSIILFFSGSYGIYWWQSHSMKEKIIPPTSPDIFHHTDTLKTPDTLKITRETVK